MRLGLVVVVICTEVLCLAGLISAAGKPQDPAEAAPHSYLVEEVRFKTEADGAIVAGTLTRPPGEGPFPVALLVSGAGLQDRDQTVYGHKPFKVLADYLTRKGIAVLRVDDRGVNGSTGDLVNATPQTFADDVLSGVIYLKHRADMKGCTIGLIGHSEGAHVATLAARKSRDVGFVVMLGGLGLPWPENNQLAQAEMLRRLGKSQGVIEAALELNERMYAIVRKGADSKSTEKLLRTAIDEWRRSLKGEAKIEFDNFTRERPKHWDWLADQFAEPAYQYYMATDPREFIRELKCPVLALCGERDVQAIPAPNLRAIEETLKASGHTDYETRELRGLNHLFQTSTTGLISEYATIKETFSTDAMAIVSVWILDRYSSQGAPTGSSDHNNGR